MNNNTFRSARQCLALALCGGAFMVSAHAQYDEFRGPAGPMVAIPQVMVKKAELSREERAQLATRRGQLTRQQEQQFNRAARRGDVRNRDLNQEADRQAQLNRQQALDQRQADQHRQEVLRNSNSGG